MEGIKGLGYGLPYFLERDLPHAILLAAKTIRMKAGPAIQALVKIAVPAAPWAPNGLGRRLDLDQIGERRIALGRPGLEPPPRARMQADERPRSVHACLLQQTIRFLPRLGGKSENRRRWRAGQA